MNFVPRPALLSQDKVREKSRSKNGNLGMGKVPRVLCFQRPLGGTFAPEFVRNRLRPQMKKYRCPWYMSTTNHNILYFGHISGINFPNKGDSLWKAPNSLARRGVKPAKSASIPVQSWPALPSLSNSSLALTAPGGKTQKRCTSVLRLWELWRFGTVCRTTKPFKQRSRLIGCRTAA